jgi:hypothetical protein
MVKLRQDNTAKYVARKRLPDDVREEYGRRHKAHYEAKFSAPASDGPHIAKQKFREWDAEVTARIDTRLLIHVRFTPKSGHQSDVRRCPLSAISRHQPLRRPNDDNESCEQKSNWSPRLMGNSSRDVGESPLHLVRTRAAGNLFPSAIASAAQSSSASRVTAGVLGF